MAWIPNAIRSEKAALFATAAIVPCIVVFLLIITFWTSAIEGVPGTGTAFTLKHYVSVYADPFTYRALLNTAGFAIVTVVVALVFGLPIAWLAEQSDLRFRPVLYALMVVGLIVPSFFVAMGWVMLLHSRIGILNLWLQAATGSPDIAIDISSVVGMGFVQGLSLAPLAFIMTAAAFRAMNPALLEAAEVHGLSRFRTILTITLPLMMPSIMAAAIYILVIGIAAFDIPAVIGLGSRIYTFSTLIYLKAINPDDIPEYGIPAAVGALMFFVALLLTWWYSRFLRSSERYEVVSGKAYKVNLVPLGRWGGAAWGFCVVYLVLSIGLPTLMVAWAAVTPFVQPPSMEALEHASLNQFLQLDWQLILRGAKNTLVLMLAVPTVTIILCIPLAWVVVRSASRWRYAYEFLSFLPHAMPAIIFGVAAHIASLFILRDVVPIYGTVWIIAIVYVVERFTFCSRVINGALMQIHRELEEVGYVSGMAVTKVLRRIFVPLVLPAMVGIWLWMALVSYRELTIATVLFHPDNITLPVVVWNLWTAGFTSAAAAVTLVMLAVLTPLVLLYWAIAGRRFAVW